MEERMAAVMAAYRAHVERQDRLYSHLPAIPYAECECPPFGTEAETPAQCWRLTRVSRLALNEAG